MGNNVPTSVIVADKMLEFFETKFKLAGLVDRQYKSTFAANSNNIGQSILVKKPARYQSVDGPVVTAAQGINKGTINITIDKWKTVFVKITGKEKTFTSKEFDIWAEKELAPIVSPLANDVEVALFNLYKKVYNFVGTPGTGPTSIGVIGSAREKLSYFNTPDDRVMFLNPTGSQKLSTTASTGIVNFYNPNEAISEAFTNGKIPRIQGFVPFESPLVAGHLGGANDGAGAVNGANQEGSSLIVDAYTAGDEFEEGDVIQIAGVYSVNPTSKVSTGLLQDFAITAANSIGTGGTLAISPPIITSGAFQNVSAGPANDAIITTVSHHTAVTYSQNLALWPKAMTLVTCPIEAPEGLNAVTRNYKGMSITLSKGADIYKFEGLYRADITFGVGVSYPEHIVRITN